MSKSKYDEIEDGSIVTIDLDNPTFRMACCDCLLVHDLDFVVRQKNKKMVIEMIVHRNNRATAQVRRWNKKREQEK